MRFECGRVPRGDPYDLFGEIPVTLEELLAWMLAVPGIAPTSARFGPYVRGYDVVEKIRAAKRSGTLEAILAARDTPAAAPYRLGAALAACGSPRVHARPPHRRSA